MCFRSAFQRVAENITIRISQYIQSIYTRYTSLKRKLKIYYFLVLSSLGGLSWVFIHYYHSSKIDKKDDINVACLQIPTSIFLLGRNIFSSPIKYSKPRKNCILGVMMLFISMFQYVRNRALRIFFRKSINNFISKIW